MKYFFGFSGAAVIALCLAGSLSLTASWDAERAQKPQVRQYQTIDEALIACRNQNGGSLVKGDGGVYVCDTE